MVDAESQRAHHVDVPTVVGDINKVLRALADHSGTRADHESWITELRAAEEKGRAADAELLAATIRTGEAEPHLRRARLVAWSATRS